MAKPVKEELLNEAVPETEYEPEFDPEDFIFIVTPEGTLKEVLFPSEDSPEEYSKKLLKVFALFGIKHPDTLLSNNYTLH